MIKPLVLALFRRAPLAEPGATDARFAGRRAVGGVAVRLARRASIKSTTLLLGGIAASGGATTSLPAIFCSTAARIRCFSSSTNSVGS